MEKDYRVKLPPNINLHLLFLGKEDPLPLGMWFLPASVGIMKNAAKFIDDI